MTSLDGALQDPIDPKTLNKIISRLWPKSPTSKVQTLDLEPYCTYYTKQSKHALHDQGKHIVVRTHQHIIDIAQQLDRLASRDDIFPSLENLFTTSSLDRKDEILNNSIDLAARLHLMINIGTDEYAVLSETQLVWQDGNLKDFLAAYFNEPPVLENKDIKLEKTFHAYNMERIAGIKIKWTDNLLDHLRIVDEDDKTIEIFHHASFLKRAQSQLFPPGLLQETLRTLALLFPRHDPLTNRYIKSLPPTITVDKQLTKCIQPRLSDRQIETYRFWHDRLIMLKQTYDQSQPATIWQWWYDRRNRVQWYTFWVAAVVLTLTIFFGMVQSIEGALQVYKAYHPTASNS